MCSPALPPLLGRPVAHSSSCFHVTQLGLVSRGVPTRGCKEYMAYMACMTCKHARSVVSVLRREHARAVVATHSKLLK